VRRRRAGAPPAGPAGRILDERPGGLDLLVLPFDRFVTRVAADAPLRTLEACRAIVVASVRSDGPAEAAGLYAGDELLAIDGERVDAVRLPARLAERPPGTTARMTVFRRDALHEIPVTLGEPPAESATIVPIEGATVEQAALREAWLAPFQR